MDIFSQLRSIIASTLGVDEAIVTPDLAAGEIPQWDSMGNMAIISRIEEEMDVEFPMDDLFDLTSVKAFADEIEKLRNGNA